MSTYTHEIKREENARVLLTIHVPQTIVADTYHTNVKEISKKAHIKGFRKGKTPISVLEQKFGDSLKADATEKVIQEAMQQTMEEVKDKPLYYSYPQLEKADDDDTLLLIDPTKDFSFTIAYETTPNVEPADIAQCAIALPKIAIDDKDLEQELKEVQNRNALTVDKNTAIENGDMVIFSTVELDDDDNEIATTAKSDVTSTIGESSSFYSIEDELIGMKKDDEKVITKTFDKEYSNHELAGNTYSIKTTISKVRTKDLPPIDDDLAQDVDEKLKTLDDLKAHLKEQLAQRADNIIEDISRQAIIQYLTDNSTLELPHSAVTMQQESLWKNFIQQYGGDEKNILQSLEQSGTKKDQLLGMWKEQATHQVKEQFILSKLLEAHKIEISDEEAEKIITEESEKSGQDPKAVLDYYKQKNIMPQIKYEIQQKKLFEILKKLAITKETNTLSYIELVAYQQELNKPKEQEEAEYETTESE